MTQRSGKHLTAEFFLGLSEDDDLRAAQRALASDPEFEAELVEWAARFSPFDDGADAEVSDTLWAGIEKRLREADEAPGLRTVTPDDGVWESIAPGVKRKIVHQDRVGQRLCYFLRLRAGAELPEHDHPSDEHCVVLEGELRIGETLFGAGSYQFAAKNQSHPPITAESPALVFIQSAN